MAAILTSGSHAYLWQPCLPLAAMLTSGSHAYLWQPCLPLAAMLTSGSHAYCTSGSHAYLWQPCLPLAAMLTMLTWACLDLMGLTARRAAEAWSCREWAGEMRRGHPRQPTLRGLSAYADDSFNQRCLLDLQREREREEEKET